MKVRRREIYERIKYRWATKNYYEVRMSILGKVVAGIVLAPIAILIIGIGGCEARKAYYDWQVRQMCEKDGGATVYEHIKLSPESAAAMGRVGGHLSITIESVAPASDIAFLRGEPSVLREGEPSIRRHEQAIVRRSDGKVAARVVRYSRAGGDFPFTVSNPSVFSCPDWPQYYAEIAKIFVMKEESK
jgi:hypothetical protein